MTNDLRDLCVHLEDRVGALAEFAAVLGRAGVSLEGGGVFTCGGIGFAHFLVRNADIAVDALTSAGFAVVAVSEVVILRLEQQTPGQLGTLAGVMADAGVLIDTQYSDHNGQLVLVVPDQLTTARTVAQRWNDADAAC